MPILKLLKIITFNVDIIQLDLTTGNVEFNWCELCNRKWEILPNSLAVPEGTGDLEGPGGYHYFFGCILPVDCVRLDLFTCLFFPHCVSESNCSLVLVAVTMFVPKNSCHTKDTSKISLLIMLNCNSSLHALVLYI